MNKAGHRPPLAERMRPAQIKDITGQEHLLGPGHILDRLGEHLPSLIFWGPPGVGKTTLAKIIARKADARFVFFSAVLSGVKEIREIIAGAKMHQERNTVLFVDEIHRFNKGQQDAFLPHVESGLITLLGATTENPSFNVIAALLSRCRVIVLNPLTPEAIAAIIDRALTDREQGLGDLGLKINAEAKQQLAQAADGDGRRALNALETAAALATEAKKNEITPDEVKEAIQGGSLRYDKSGEEHYNLISALHKSMRDSDPDASLYWLARMLAAGEDPLYIARRLIRFASEDIGNADPAAITLALSARESYHILGSPEGELALAQAAIYLATAPKSNASYRAMNQVMAKIKETGSLPVPMAVRNSPTRLMKDLGYGKDYRYAHDQTDALVPQEHLPEAIRDTVFYQPTNRGHEAIISDRLQKWRRILADKAQKGKRKE